MSGDTVWLALGALAQIGLCFSVPTSIWLYYRGESRAREAARRDEQRSMDQFKREERDKFYAQLDETYMRILSMVVENPQLGVVDRHRDSEGEARYDAFAFIVWNFIESIYDYCLEDETLKRTWQCILEYEGRSHQAWFNKPENRVKFKEEFCRYMEAKVFA